MFQRTLLYLGLAPEEEYDDLDNGSQVAHVPDVHSTGAVEVTPASPPPQPHAQAGSPASEVEQGAVRTIGRDEAVAAGAKVSPITAAPSSASVRTMPVSTSKPHVVAPHQFNEAQALADRFKADQAVILNLQEVERDLRRRLIDFASGLSYGLGGRMERVADGVYLLTPANVEVSDEERRLLSDGLPR